ncbi:TetR/AcrR family transcriptional regulator [Pseudogracilibacillus auburnensis]|uniref:TetR/AcrR family transcriptional regulator n=1 Tax=Pseudogracilibacillus auburnensis TaxID=1494959 RepID=UPI001A97D042|nr:TetR/AcrR family transcriptional regulator [Pseudogracilibacillus auburnensis]MBO1001898.1 TetR family transcriptional regulator [Pseudogracilibacillus auburnensis]
MMNQVEQAIIESTIKLFSEKGYAATSIRDIAKSVNITSASLYHYMDSKKDLLEFIMERYLLQLIDGAHIAIDQATCHTTKLKSLIKYHVQSHGNERLAALVVDTEYRSLEGSGKVKIKELRKKYETIWSHILEAGLKEGIFSFPNLKITSFSLISLCTGVAHWYRDNGTFSLKEIAEQYAELGLHMVQNHSMKGGE